MSKGSGGGGRPGRTGGGSPAETIAEFDKNISIAQREFNNAREKHADLISLYDRGKATKEAKDAALAEKKKWRDARDDLEAAKAEYVKKIK